MGRSMDRFVLYDAQIRGIPSCARCLVEAKGFRSAVYYMVIPKNTTAEQLLATWHIIKSSTRMRHLTDGGSESHRETRLWR